MTKKIGGEVGRPTKYKLHGFQEWMIREGHSQATVRQYASYIRGVLNCLTDSSEIENPEFIEPRLNSEFKKAAWRKYRSYMLYKQEVLSDDQKPAFIPCSVEKHHKCGKVSVDVLTCHAVKSMLDGLESMALDNSKIVMLKVGSLVVNSGVVIVTTITDDKIKLLNSEAADLLLNSDGKRRDFDEPLVVSPWTGKAATYREWKRMASIASQTPIDEETFKALHCKSRIVDSVSKVKGLTRTRPPRIAMPIDTARSISEAD